MRIKKKRLDSSGKDLYHSYAKHNSEGFPKEVGPLLCCSN